MNDNDTPRAEHVIPPGFRPMQWPHVVDLDAQTSTDDEPMIVAQGDLRATAEALGSMELLAAILKRSAPGGSPIAEQIEGMARFWKQHVRLIGGITAAFVMAVAVLAATPPAPAAAAEGPEPDPVAVSVTLTAGSVSVGVPVTTRSVDSHGKHCASVWGPTYYGRGFVGRICSRRSSFVVPVALDSRYVPVGRSTMAVTDDVNPLATFPQVVNLTARRPSKFGVGRWVPLPQGQLYVSAGLYAYTPAKGAWTPQQSSPVAVQESTRRGWRTRATLTTTSSGVASGVVYLGGGAHIVRVARIQGATVEATTGTAHTFVLAPEVPIETN